MLEDYCRSVVMHFPVREFKDNLADKAKRLGIAVWKFGGA